MGVKEIQVESTQGIEQGLKRYNRIYGYESLAHRLEYDTYFPIKRGIIEDFEHMTNCWQHVITHK
jgi:actin-related protein